MRVSMVWALLSVGWMVIACLMDSPDVAPVIVCVAAASIHLALEKKE